MKRLFCLLAAVILLVSCSPPANPFTEPSAAESENSREESSSSEPDSSIQEEPSEPVVPAESEKTEPVQALGCFSQTGFIRDMKAFPNGDLLICAGEAAPQEGYYLDESAGAAFYRIDPLEDRILDESAADKTISQIFGFLHGEQPVCWNMINSQIEVYDASFTLSAAYDLPPTASLFFYGSGTESIYYTENSHLFSQRLGEEPSVLLEDALNLSIASIQSETGRMVLTEPSDALSSVDIYSLFDPQNQQISFSGDDNYGLFCFSRDALLRIQDYWINEQEETHLYVLDPASGAELGCWQLKPYETLFCDEKCSTVIGFCYNDPDPLRLIDPVTGRSAVIPVPQKSVQDCPAAVWDDAAGVWVVAVSDADGLISLICVDPEGLSLEDPMPEAGPAPVIEPEQPADLGEPFAEVRAKADAIEEKYGVRILLGNEIYGVNLQSGYTLISAEDLEYAEISDGEAYTDRLDDPEENVAILLDNLNLLDASMATLPEDFFSHFKSGSGNGGLRIALVRALVNEDGVFKPGGCFSSSGPWFNLIMDMTAMDEPMFQHELWHAVEYRITQSDGFSFDSEQWDRLNPEGFFYTADYEGYATEGMDQSLYDYLLWAEKDPYFVRDYSTVAAAEDRATLMESLYDVYYDEDVIEHSNYDRVMSYPHLQEKLAYMGEQTEKIFGSVYWDRSEP